MHRQVRPEPTRLSSYFFEYVTEEDAAQQREATQAVEPLPPKEGCPTSPPATTPGETEGAPSPAVMSWSPAPVTHDPRIDGCLQSAHMPLSFREPVANFMLNERRRTERLRREGEAAWQQVELMIACNQQRRAEVEDILSASAAWRTEVKRRRFWQAENIIRRYDFQVGAPMPGTRKVATTATSSSNMANAEGDSYNMDGHIVVDFSVDLDDALGGTSQAAEESANDNAAGSSSKKAKSWDLSDEELLDPRRRVHCLRRLFTSLQQKREELPRWTNLLLTEVRNVQVDRLRSLEERLQELLSFRIPLHRPFHEVVSLLQRYVQMNREGPQVESERVTLFRQIMGTSANLQSYVATATAAQKKERDAVMESRRIVDHQGYSCPNFHEGEDDLIEPLGPQRDTAETMWNLLFSELDGYKEFYESNMKQLEHLTAAVKEEHHQMVSLLDDHRKKSRDIMEGMLQDIAVCTEAFTTNGRHTLAAVEEMSAKYSRESGQLKKSIQEKDYRLRSSEAQQEKCVRRVREAIKDLFVEQVKYDETAQELLQDELSLVQLETSYHQLRRAVQRKQDEALLAEQHASSLRDVLKDGDEALCQLFDACERHVGRLEVDDFYARCRLTEQCTATLQQQCRCLHDMSTLYEKRVAAIETKARGSWQLQFLVAGELDWAVSNMVDVRQEFTLLEKKWEEICKVREALELDPVQLDAVVGESQWEALRNHLPDLDCCPRLHRHVVTLRTHGDAASPPLAICAETLAPSATHAAET